MGETQQQTVRLNRRQRRAAGRLFTAAMRDGDFQWRQFCGTVNGLGFWRRVPLAWAVLRGRLA